MHGLAHRLIATEGKRDIGYATGNMRARQFFANARGCFDKINGVIIMLGYTGRHGENIRVENDIFGREIKFLGQQII